MIRALRGCNLRVILEINWQLSLAAKCGKSKNCVIWIYFHLIRTSETEEMRGSDL